MKENLQNTVNEALKGIIDTATQIKQFSLEQIPDILNQLLMYKLAEAISGIVLGLIIIILSYFAFSKWSNQRMEYGMWADSKTASAIIGGAASIIAFIVVIVSISDILKITIAPKLYLIEYAVHLIK